MQVTDFPLVPISGDVEISSGSKTNCYTGCCITTSQHSHKIKLRKESESVDKKDEIEVKIHVDTTELVDAIEKANRLVCVLKEVNTLIHSLLGAEQSKT